MAQNTTVSVPANTWTQLTNADVTNTITFQNLDIAFPMRVKGTTSASAPTTDTASIEYEARQGERNVALADLFPGLSGVVRLYAYSGNAISVFVSHD